MIEAECILQPTEEQEAIALTAKPKDTPETNLPERALGFRVQEYGMTKWRDLFTDRQLEALTTFSDLVAEARERIQHDAVAAGMPDDVAPLCDGGAGAEAYAEAAGVYLAFAVDKCVDYWSTVCTWHTSREKIRNTFGRQAIPMTWDYAEANPISTSSGNYTAMLDWVWKCLDRMPATYMGSADLGSAQNQTISTYKVVSTDPPYYDNIGYADLSDFFYVWLRRSLQSVFPDLFHYAGCAKSRGVGSHTLSPRQQDEGGDVLLRWHDHRDAAPCRSGPPRVPNHHLLRLQTVGESG